MDPYVDDLEDHVVPPYDVGPHGGHALDEGGHADPGGHVVVLEAHDDEVVLPFYEEVVQDDQDADEVAPGDLGVTLAYSSGDHHEGEENLGTFLVESLHACRSEMSMQKLNS